MTLQTTAGGTWCPAAMVALVSACVTARRRLEVAAIINTRRAVRRIHSRQRTAMIVGLEFVPSSLLFVTATPFINITDCFDQVGAHDSKLSRHFDLNLVRVICGHFDPSGEATHQKQTHSADSAKSPTSCLEIFPPARERAA